MPKKTKKFIDRKNAVTFHLVHRSQQDPLIADENAPQRVLLPVQDKLDKKKRIEEQQKYGIYFDDDYNYLQHLKDLSNKVEWSEAIEPQTNEAKIQLPSSVFASSVEEDVGLLNKAAPHSGPRPELDSDIIAALDDDFDYDNPENILEDNFIELANAKCSEDEAEYDSDEEAYSDIDSNVESEIQDEISPLKEPQHTFKDEETKSRFTEYSMSSSVIKRNKHLALLDDRFEQMFADYDDNDIGPLDCEEIEGHVSENSDILLRYAEEFQNERKTESLDKETIIKEVVQSSEDEDEDEDLVEMEVPEKMKWDCESILSTNSNIYNHPKLIQEPSKQKIKINMRTGMPSNVLGTNKLTVQNVSQLNEQSSLDKKGDIRSFGAPSIISTLSTLSIRPKDETPEEKRQRKHNLKEYRRERRREKKLNTQAFKEEARQQNKIAINNIRNINGNRLL